MQYCRAIRVIILLLLFVNTLAWAQLNHITGLRIARQGQRSRFVFSATQPIHSHRFMLVHPTRLVVDIAKAKLTMPLNHHRLGGTPVKDFRVGHHAHHSLRIVFDLKYPVTVKTYSSGRRLVVILTHKKASHLAKKKPPPRRHHHTTPRPVLRTVPDMQKLHKIIVVIDPGHGGKDPGATGPDGHHEKVVVLAIAKDLQHMLNAQPGFHAVLTRRHNYFVSLRGRLRITRHDKADLFIAIHADAFPDRHASGASVYALSERGATSEAAHWLAASENRSELMGGVNLAHKDNLLRSVLINLSQNHTIAVSLQIGSSILHQLSKNTELHHGRVEQAAFVVLKSPDIPSLLVETGFITNPHEERRLVTATYQHRLAYAIMLGIKAYFVHHPPAHTVLAARRGGKHDH